MALLWSSGANAAINWCRCLPLLPSSSLSFEQIAAGIDRLGCEAVPQNSAHARLWLCTDQEAGDTSVMLTHLVSRYGEEPNLLTIEGPALTSLRPFRLCGVQEPARGNRVGEFNPGSIAIQDRLVMTRDYRVATIDLLRIAGLGTAVSGYPERLEGTALVEIAEAGLFGIRRQSYPSTSVEIAGRNLINSPAREVVAALEARGARVVSSDPLSQVAHATVLTPPLGLDGVSRVTVQALGQHVLQIHYRVTGLAEYQNFIGLLDERYGRSAAQSGRESDRRNCRDRFWFSGKITIVGEYCPATGYGIWFNNMVVDEQRRAHLAHLRSLQANPTPDTSRRRRIDPDNF